MLKAHSQICEKIANLSTQFLSNFDTWKLECALVSAKNNLAQTQLLWLTTLNQHMCQDDYEENLAFYAEEMEEIEAELRKLQPKFLKRFRKKHAMSSNDVATRALKLSKLTTASVWTFSRNQVLLWMLMKPLVVGKC